MEQVFRFYGTGVLGTEALCRGMAEVEARVFVERGVQESAPEGRGALRRMARGGAGAGALLDQELAES